MHLPISPQHISLFWKCLPWALLICTALVWYYTSRPAYSVSQALDELQQAHQIQLTEIQRARDVERAELEANVRAYEATLLGIARDHSAALDELARAKKGRTETLVKDYSGDPDRLAEHLSRILSLIGKE